jgi:hypothetical protein
LDGGLCNFESCLEYWIVGLSLLDIEEIGPALFNAVLISVLIFCVDSHVLERFIDLDLLIFNLVLHGGNLPFQFVDAGQFLLFACFQLFHCRAAAPHGHQRKHILFLYFPSLLFTLFLDFFEQFLAQLEILLCVFNLPFFEFYFSPFSNFLCLGKQIPVFE